MKRPNPFVYIPLGFLLKIFGVIKQQHYLHRLKIKGPAITLSNHTSFYDFIYTFNAIYPRRTTFLAASKMFLDPLLGFFLKLGRCIPKALFQTDHVSLMKSFRILKQKGIISIFPEGEISPTGKFMRPTVSMAKFIKKAGVDLYIIKHHNVYFVNPPWTKKSFRGRIETDMVHLYTPLDLETLSVEEIYEGIYQALFHDPKAYNAIKQYKYKRNRIDKLENLIYECPSCKKIGLKPDKYSLVCPHCGNKLTLDVYGTFSNYSVDDLYELQRDTLKKHLLEDENFELSHPVKLEGYQGDKVSVIGEGTLTLSKKGHDFKGTVLGKETHYHFDPKDVPTLPSDIGRNVQIYVGYELFQFVFSEPQVPTQYILLAEILYEQAKQGE